MHNFENLIMIFKLCRFFIEFLFKVMKIFVCICMGKVRTIFDYAENYTFVS